MLTYIYLGILVLMSPSNDSLLLAAVTVWLCQPLLSENRKLMCVHCFTLPGIDYAASALIILYNKSQSIQDARHVQMAWADSPDTLQLNQIVAQ